MSRRFLLRAEAINLGGFVNDTSRLPTIRGGGLLLLRAPKSIEEWLRGDPRAANVESLRAGASACVLGFEAEPAQAEAIRDEIERKLGADERLRHATFAVDFVAAGEDFVADLEKLLALNRFRQMRSPSVAFPGEEGQGACAIDGIRPGTSPVRLPGEETWRKISVSVRVRDEYGRRQKQAFYREEADQDLGGEDLESLDDMRFSRDFQDLAADSGKGRLDGKMAVLYLDGNGFGAIQKEHCLSAADAQRFDRTLQDGKRAMLAGVLAAIRENPEGWTLGEGESRFYRLETLLWGGDELLFVVPAWKGWWLLSQVFARLRGLEFGVPLSFAAGLVFCHAKAPIRRIKELADQLAGEAKERSRTESFAAYQVMESFDVVPGDFDAFRNRRSAGGRSSNMLVPAAQIASLEDAVRELKPLVPRKRIYRQIENLLAGSGETARQKLVDHGSAAAWARLEAAGGAFAAGALHLAELWDYLPEENGRNGSAVREVAHAG